MTEPLITDEMVETAWLEFCKWCSLFEGETTSPEGIRAALSAVAPMIRAQTFREAAAGCEQMSDQVSRVLASGWRGNPNMSGDDRDFMRGDHRRRHDEKVGAAISEISVALLALAQKETTR